ncbi:hypothetical protein ONS95_014548 [Cadophora gregata]|uniref:uncharacterized protein n=1 Tax=Cadophora gregata TaxID=51156 RepID=UPI0026DBD912|nr:uncharacterized protein ONS95_014548 [Cadophora gregata]KAK0112820.1 hypothetical protein ONS95_014548 [Cadophora gregata]
MTMTHPHSRLTIHTSTLFDPRQKKFLSDVSITVDTITGLITSIITRDDMAFPLPDPLPDDAIDLRGRFVMPGFVNAHTHIFSQNTTPIAHPDLNPGLNLRSTELNVRFGVDTLLSASWCGDTEISSSTSPTLGFLKREESSTERIIRAVNHAQTALLAGYTTYRDLGSEGMKDADTELRNAISKGLIPGPRLFVATRPLASGDTFGMHDGRSARDSCIPVGAEGVNGVEEIRYAVRKRIIAGADVISFFADYPRKTKTKRAPSRQQHPYTAGVLCLLKGLNPDFVTFSQEEMDMIVAEARLARRPVAASCESLEGAMAAIKAGVRSIEGGYGVTEGIMRAMAEKGVILVPNLASAEVLQPLRLPALSKQTKRAYDLGVRLACGGRTGILRHGDKVREMELMVECGIPLEDVLESCMVGGWESCGGALCGRRFGWFEEGTQADIIAFEMDPRVDIGALKSVDFVMKDAKVWKLNGNAVENL